MEFMPTVLRRRRMVLAIGLGLTLAVLSVSLLFLSHRSCVSQVLLAGAEFVVTPANKACSYSLVVGHSFAVRVVSGPDASKYWPVQLSDERLVAMTGAVVGSPDAIWTATYRTLWPGVLRLNQYDVTVNIRA